MVVDGESDAWPEFLQQWSNYLTEAKREHEIIVVAPRKGSTPSAAANLKVLVEEKPGFGAALRGALKEAHHPLLLYLPVQPQWRPEFLQPFLERIDPVDLVSGSRTGTPVPPPLRWLGFFYRGMVRVVFGIPLEPLPGWLGWRGYLYQRLIRILFGVRFHDVDCPFKLFRREIFRRIPIQSDSSFVHTELMAKANFLSCLADEAPVPVPPTRSHWWQDFRQVFFHPEFRPPLETEKKSKK